MANKDHVTQRSKSLASSVDDNDDDRLEEGGEAAERLLTNGDSRPDKPSSLSVDNDSSSKEEAKPKPPVVSRTGFFVLVLLAAQNCSKNLLMRYVMKDQPKFLTSAAVIGSECLKLSLSTLYILLIERRSIASIFTYLREDRRNTMLLVVPASAYNLQMSLEYVALANLDAAMFSVLVQTKLLFTATFAATVLRKKLKYIQVISLVLLTVGVMLCNLSKVQPKEENSDSSTMDTKTWKGCMATLGIAVSSGFASVYTEKVIKSQASTAKRRQRLSADYGLAYTQVQLASMSLVTIGVYALMTDWVAIRDYGLFHNFSNAAFLSIASSACGGLIVAGVLKYADSVLKGYSTACSVILTGMLSMVLFGTELSVIYFMGIINVVTAVLLYNGKDMDQYVCS